MRRSARSDKLARASFLPCGAERGTEKERAKGSLVCARALVLVVAAVSLFGCGGNDVRLVDLAPGTAGTFTFSARTNTVMTENADGAAERIRRDWLAEALTLDGVCSAGYVVDSRRLVQPQDAPFANGGDIVYPGRCLSAGVSPAVVRP